MQPCVHVSSHLFLPFPSYAFTALGHLTPSEEKAEVPEEEGKENPLRRLRKCLDFDEVGIPDGELSGAAEALSKEKSSVEKFLKERVAMVSEDTHSAAREADDLISQLETQPGFPEELAEEPTGNITPTVTESTPEKNEVHSPTRSVSPEAPFKPRTANPPVPAPKRRTAAKSVPKRKATPKENRDPNKGKDGKKMKQKDPKDSAASKIEKKPEEKSLPADKLEKPNSEKPDKLPRKKRSAVPQETVGTTPSGSSSKPTTKKAKRATTDSDKGAAVSPAKPTTKKAKRAKTNSDKDTDADKKEIPVPEVAPKRPTEKNPEDMDEEKDVKVYADGWTDALLKKKLHSVP
eukprot:s780_g14.t1